MSKKTTYTGPLMPGQWIDKPKSKPVATRESRILAAINSGKGLKAAAIEAAEADELGFGDQHLEALIDQVKEEIESRLQMQTALEAHYRKRT